jgi:hypothetical protein
VVVRERSLAGNGGAASDRCEAVRSSSSPLTLLLAIRACGSVESIEPSSDSGHSLFTTSGTRNRRPLTVLLG